MKKVEMKTLSAGPGGTLVPGQIVEMPDDEAEQMVAGGYAQYVKVEEKPIETATAEAPENTTKKAPVRRKAGRKR